MPEGMIFLFFQEKRVFVVVLPCKQKPVVPLRRFKKSHVGDHAAAAADAKDAATAAAATSQAASNQR